MSMSEDETGAIAVEWIDRVSMMQNYFVVTVQYIKSDYRCQGTDSGNDLFLEVRWFSIVEFVGLNT